MKIKQKLKPFIYAAAVLCMSLSCKKEPIPEPDYSCNDGTCCGLPGAEYVYIGKFENEPVTLSNSGLPGIGFKNPVSKRGGGFICDISYDKIKNLEITWDPFTKPVAEYKYRASGKIFYDKNIRVISQYSYFDFISIEKIEIIK